MATKETAFEVRVRVRESAYPKEYNSKYGMYTFAEIVKMYHYFTRTAKQALHKAEKHGIPLSVRKVQTSILWKDYEALPLKDGVYQAGNPYENAVAMDEMIFQKRVSRRGNSIRDKKDY